MQTVQEFVENYLYQNGLFESEARTIVERFKATESAQPMAQRWQHPADDYQKPVMGVLLMKLRIFAYDWLLENEPQHWALNVFKDYGIVLWATH